MVQEQFPQMSKYWPENLEPACLSATAWQARHSRSKQAALKGKDTKRGRRRSAACKRRTAVCKLTTIPFKEPTRSLRVRSQSTCFLSAGQGKQLPNSLRRSFRPSRSRRRSTGTNTKQQRCSSSTRHKSLRGPRGDPFVLRIQAFVASWGFTPLNSVKSLTIFAPGRTRGCRKTQKA